eukprot:CAMPEP_0114554104 /NCGR_PEP_ID=MMETSP0114-20121206/8030_1 /TAXON_ID=31324 /ORGANISM="Goniomonas sp, Strain m" /LENGTH=78 /DNA_ID=CAMNT_0001739125 /DNA_START=388 /DNA_END=623 /DNA_ORIENTATION=+
MRSEYVAGRAAETRPARAQEKGRIAAEVQYPVSEHVEVKPGLGFRVGWAGGTEEAGAGTGAGEASGGAGADSTLVAGS